jgi:deoxycytidylate deaminase
MELTKSHKAYFKAAKAVSSISDFHKVRIGCVAVYSHRIISSGTNSTKTNPLQKKYNIHRFDVDSGHTLHAESQCLLPLVGRKDIDFSRMSLYIYREHKDKTLALSRPCKSCERLIRDLGIKKVYYTGNGSYIAENFI